MPKQKGPTNPPHISLKALRDSHHLTLEQLAEKVSDVLGIKVSRGTLNAIENSKRGASRQMLDAIAAAFDLPSGAITTDYDPRESRVHKEAS